MRTNILDVVNKVGETVELFGWVQGRRDHGQIIFIDLRDRSGVVQVVFTPKNDSVISGQAPHELYTLASTLRSEWVVQLIGEVKARPEKMINPELPTGKIEIQPVSLEVLAEAQTPPFALDTDGREISEELRLQYRYLDLRRARLQRNIKLRSEFIDRARQFLFKKDFLEIETPILTESTPEGSRDFVVPSRLHPGKFFALPQSPQQYKQLLMVAGMERYFQIARCFRDEDLRADRGFEHTQIDLEMSFVKQADVMALDEEMITTVVEGMGFKIKQKPFPLFSYKEAMAEFGADKFDLRSEEEKKNGVLAYAWVKDFPFFEKNEAGNWTFTHNPFSLAQPEHIEWLMKGQNVDQIMTTQYDLVCNGFEVGGGSLRAHQSDHLRAVLRVMGYGDERIERSFGHMLEAFRYGAPPHGGIAHGVERNLMTLAGEESLREVQAFPQTSSGHTSVMNAPSELEKDQRRELHLKINE